MNNGIMGHQARCSVCGSTQLRFWGERNGYKLYKCLSCSHKFADLKNQVMAQDNPDRFREEFTHGLMSTDQEYYDHLIRGERLGMTSSITADHVLELCQNESVVEGGSWLDIGCGSGHLLRRAQDSGFHAIGIEPGGWGQIAAAHKNINVIQGFLTPDTFDRRFDVISATDVVEHLPDPVSFFRLMASYLQVRGHIVITIPFADSFEAKLMGIRWDMVEPPTHSQFFSRLSLKLALRLAGLESISMRQYNLRHLGGLVRYKLIRHTVDMFIPGPQLVCLVRKINIL
jgi:2-polyprenyl-3-methyl-5-hydroxy-6-metoxy-1,4-benzoquinol methylase